MLHYLRRPPPFCAGSVQTYSSRSTSTRRYIIVSRVEGGIERGQDLLHFVDWHGDGTEIGSPQSMHEVKEQRNKKRERKRELKKGDDGVTKDAEKKVHTLNSKKG